MSANAVVRRGATRARRAINNHGSGETHPVLQICRRMKKREGTAAAIMAGVVPALQLDYWNGIDAVLWLRSRIKAPPPLQNDGPTRGTMWII
jgi:hypothetical protein